MTEPSVDQLRTALARHASSAGEVFPSAVSLIAAEEHWSGRMWDVLGLVAADIDTMRYVAGGVHPDVIAECTERWSDSPLSLEDIALVLACGGYDPDPFVTLGAAGLLRTALCYDDGSHRLFHGERAGAWVSDELALASPDEIIEQTGRMISDTGQHSERQDAKP